MITKPNFPNLLFFRIFDNEPRLAHFSSTRLGGVSGGEFQSLNMGNYSDDSPLNIFENRAAVARMFYKEPTDIITPHQTHSGNVLLIDTDFLNSPASEKTERLYNFDAAITRERGFFIGICTADCVPILLYDKKNEAVAAIHAGWRGTVQRIVQNTLAEMKKSFGTETNDVLAAIGPSISMRNYEVGDEVVQQLRQCDFEINSSNSQINSVSKKTHLDLKEINRQELLRLGVPKQQIEKSRYCTFQNSRLFFSARRQSIHSGRMLTGIMLK